MSRVMVSTVAVILLCKSGVLAGGGGASTLTANEVISGDCAGHGQKIKSPQSPRLIIYSYAVECRSTNDEHLDENEGESHPAAK
jgi:hypothetical protein